MRYAIVKSTDLATRWDPAFHLLREEHKELTARLETGLTPAEVANQLRSLPLGSLRPLLQLSRRSQPTLDRESIDRIIAEYPHLSLALVISHLPTLKAEIDRARTRLAQEETAIEALKKAMEKFQ